MAIEPDPKSDNVNDDSEEFNRHFDEFASGKKTPDPNEEKDEENPEQPDGNGPGEDEPSSPAEDDKSKAADEGEDKTEEAASGEADKEPHGEKPSGEQAPDDEWAALPPEVKEKVLQLQREKEEAVHRAASDANRVAALRRQLHQAKLASPHGAKPSDEKPTEAQKALDGKIKQLREDYGDIAEPLLELIEHQRNELTTVHAQLDGLSEAQQAQVIAAETQALQARHPDWRSVAQSPDFAGWLEVQPDNIQRLAGSWDARETSVVLTLFKAERMQATGQQQQRQEQDKKADPAEKAAEKKPDAATGARRSQQLDGGRDVRSRPAPAASGPPEDFDSAFDFYVARRQAKARR